MVQSGFIGSNVQRNFNKKWTRKSGIKAGLNLENDPRPALDHVFFQGTALKKLWIVH
jgi:hypothetical protein